MLPAGILLYQGQGLKFHVRDCVWWDGVTHFQTAC
jgi:hypothetical protein